MPKEIDEDLIEATIRRVAESQTRGERPAIEMPVAESIAPVIANDDDDEGSSEAAAVTARLAAYKSPAPADDGEQRQPMTLRQSMSGLPATPMRMNPSKSAPSPAAAAAAPATVFVPPPAPTPITARQAQAPPAIAPDNSAQLQAIIERLDVALPLLERLVARAGGEWDRDPSILRAQTGMPRPAVLLDASQRAVTQEPDVIDTRPIPKPLPPLVEPKRGLDLLPRTYRITVEDKRRGVDLVPLHRAMLSTEGVRDMSLLSYNNGVAIVALETTDELDPELLRVSVSRAMARDARVEVHNESTMVVKLSEE